VSEPKRYLTDSLIPGDDISPDAVGEVYAMVVRYKDYSALKRRFEICEEYAEGLERFIKSEAADIKRLKEERDNLDKQLNDEINKSAMLCGQKMRLTEAGDSMVWAFEKGSHQTKADAILVWIDIKAWNAAKEGKQS
jgi:hypothetical protein